jgi:hypothetical protein
MDPAAPYGPGWRRASRALARECVHCRQRLSRGDLYRRHLTLPFAWEHLRCYQGLIALSMMAEPSFSPREGKNASGEETYGLCAADGELAAGYGANFPGVTVEWTWVSPPGWPPYRLHLAGLAYRRRLIEGRLGPDRTAGLRRVASRLLDKLVSPEALADACREAEGEFEMPAGMALYWLAALGVALLGRERVAEAEAQGSLR